ncbi:allophanate hydrolase [Rhodobacterales bacterium HKCCE2091]|nr:allophanate hydrolase [Rhodobacterales bacterium HKCCE2091]
MTDMPMTLDAIRAAYAGGASPADVVAEVYRRIAAWDDPGIFIHLPPLDAALAAAASIGAPGPDRPLWGIPFAVKDNIDVAGMPTTAACPAFTYQPDRDATVVARLRAAGAIPIGKTNLDQFATGLVGVRTPYPVPRNTLDPAIVPGGSSSGSAVAVAAGIVPFALGTDTAGSGRVPAALNNIVGLKPSLGAISTRGVVPACRTLDCVSVFALSVGDAWSAYAAAAGYDAEDAYSRPVPVGPLSPPLPAPRAAAPDAGSLRVFGDAAQAEAFEAQIAALEALGARVDRIDFAPFYQIADMLYAGPWVAERHAVLQPLLDADPDAIDPVVRGIVSGATAQSATDAFRAFYRMAELKRAVAPILDAFDMLCVPTIPTFVTVAEIAADGVGPNSRLGTYTNFVNLLGLCGLAVPMPARSDGRPGSITLLAADGRDAMLAAIGARLEMTGTRSLGATGWTRPETPAPATGAGPDEIEIAVCGAHMSGLPLNHELTSRGARFLRAVDTTPDYRLYRLPGGAPPRPGMVRAAGGGAISVEVWALPRAAFGDFMSGIPAPLSIGTVTLSDGTSPKGFLCEAAAVAGAKDVTAAGSWRKVIAGEAA